VGGTGERGRQLDGQLAALRARPGDSAASVRLASRTSAAGECRTVLQGHLVVSRRTLCSSSSGPAPWSRSCAGTRGAAPSAHHIALFSAGLTGDLAVRRWAGRGRRRPGVAPRRLPRRSLACPGAGRNAPRIATCAPRPSVEENTRSSVGRVRSKPQQGIVVIRGWVHVVDARHENPSPRRPRKSIACCACRDKAGATPAAAPGTARRASHPDPGPPDDCARGHRGSRQADAQTQRRKLG